MNNKVKAQTLPILNEAWRPEKWAALICLLLSILFWGCAREPDPIVVDFNKTLPLKKPARPNAPSLKVAVGAMVSPKETFIHYQQLFEFIGRKLNSPVDLIQRKTYQEINRLLARGEIDIAFICSGPYAGSKNEYGFQEMAVPQVQNSHFYRSYLIVNANKPFQHLEDLRGKVFAFTDPESNTGRLAPVFWLHQMGEKPETFFSKAIYTYSHDNSILAVSRGLVDGAAVDSLVWEYLQSTRPELTRSIRIIRKSEPFAIPPVVASREFPPEKRDRVRQILLSMNHDEEGRHILKGLMIDRFIAPPADWFKNAGEIRKRTALLKEEAHVPKKP
jgi:phosphonate transport system substrate-binding protein